MGRGMGASAPERDDQTFTIISVSFAGDGNGYLLELYDSKAIETMKKERANRRSRWDSMEHMLEPEGVFPFIVQGQRVFLPVTRGEFQRLAPYVGMIVKVSVTAVGA